MMVLIADETWWYVVGIREGFPHQYPHTLVIGYDNQWTVSERNAMALLYCFGHALGLAKRLYGVIFLLSSFLPFRTLKIVLH